MTNLGEAALVCQVSGVDQDVAFGQFESAVVRVRDADKSRAASLSLAWKMRHQGGDGLPELDLVVGPTDSIQRQV